MNTSLDAVAVDAGVDGGCLYHHFPGKRELFEAVFEDEQRRLCEHIVEAQAGRFQPMAGISAFLKAALDPKRQQIVFLDAPHVLGWERIREIQERYVFALLKANVRQGIATSKLQRHDGDALARMLYGALCDSAMFVARAGDPKAAKREAEQELERLLLGLNA